MCHTFRDVPYGGIQLMIFEGVKSYIISSTFIDLDVNSLWGEALVGALAGSLAAFITAPMDRVTILILSGSLEASESTQNSEENGIGGSGTYINNNGCVNFFILIVFLLLYEMLCDF